MSSKPRGRGSAGFRIGYLVHDVSRLRQAFFTEKMRPHGLTHAQWWALGQLIRHDPVGGLTQAELARALGLGKVATGAMIAGLEVAGLVERRADAADRRLNRVFVTARGSRVVERMVSVAETLNAALLQGLAREDLDATIRVLTELRRRLQDAPKAG